MPKTSIFDNCKSEETNNIKMRDYKRFINAVIENPLLRSSEIVEEFITKEQNEFNILKLKYKNTKKVVEMKNFITIDGELDATFYQNNFKLSLKYQKILEKKRSLLVNLNNSIKDVVYQLENINSKINNLSQIFEELSLLYKNIRLELDEVDKLFSDYKYAKINFEGCENNIITHKKAKSEISEEYYQFQLKQKEVEKDNAKRICCFLQNRACDEYKRILQAHKIRIIKLFSFLRPNLYETYQKEYENLIKLINNFSN